MEPQVAIALAKNRQVRAALVAAVSLVVLAPVLAATAVTGVLAKQQEERCATAGPVETPAGGGPVGEGQYAAPLQLEPGRTYEVGATEYGGPGDPSSGSYGSIPDTGQSYLPAHPDSYAELSVLDSNPANSGTFTFADANALNHLPYMTALRVIHDGHAEVLYKRDIGYGQGPGQQIENGQPYRLDLWWQAAQALGVTKSAVQIQLAPRTGAGATLGALQQGEATLPEATEGANTCLGSEGAGSVPLPLAPGDADADPAERPGRRRTRSTRGRAGDGRRREPAAQRLLPLRRRTRHLTRHLAAGVRLLLRRVLPAARRWGPWRERRGLDGARELR
jgi:hypothetical protein